jgi:hypothetical protein
VGQHRRGTDRLLRLETGSALIEGTAALGAAFLLLTLLVQIGAAVAAREAAQSAVAAAARRAALPDADAAAERSRLVGMLAATIPGARDVETSVRRGGSTATASAGFRWIPPGPDWTAIEIRVEARAPLVVPP